MAEPRRAAAEPRSGRAIALCPGCAARSGRSPRAAPHRPLLRGHRGAELRSRLSVPLSGRGGESRIGDELISPPFALGPDRSSCVFFYRFARGKSGGQPLGKGNAGEGWFGVGFVLVFRLFGLGLGFFFCVCARFRFIYCGFGLVFVCFGSARFRGRRSPIGVGARHCPLTAPAPPRPTASPRRCFGTKCAGCAQGISPSDLVRRARSKVFHLNCFTCMMCNKQLSTGEELYIIDENKFVCKEDYLNNSNTAKENSLHSGEGARGGGSPSPVPSPLPPPGSRTPSDCRPFAARSYHRQ